MGQHSAREYRLIMAVVSAILVIGAASSISPLVDHAAGVGVAVLFGLLALAGLAYIGRELLRELRFRAEMRTLDRRDAARLNAATPPVVRATNGGRR